jgi:hypothetical protein
LPVRGRFFCYVRKGGKTQKPAAKNVSATGAGCAVPSAAEGPGRRAHPASPDPVGKAVAEVEDRSDILCGVPDFVRTFSAADSPIFPPEGTPMRFLTLLARDVEIVVKIATPSQDRVYMCVETAAQPG